MLLYILPFYAYGIFSFLYLLIFYHFVCFALHLEKNVHPHFSTPSNATVCRRNRQTHLIARERQVMDLVLQVPIQLCNHKMIPVKYKKDTFVTFYTPFKNWIEYTFWTTCTVWVLHPYH